MGHNLDLCDIYGLNNQSVCPRCGKTYNNYLDEYDIDCGNPINNGSVELDMYCTECEYEYKYRFEVNIIEK